MNLQEYKDQRIHMIGIGGSSMSGLCEMLLQQGYQVTGSDNTHSHAVERLEEKGVRVTIGHKADTVHGAGLIIYSAAIHEDNPERAEAFRLGVPQMDRAVLLGQLMLGHKHNICVSGAHGKTTTSSMIAQILLEADMDPAVSIGGRLDAIGGGSRVGGEEVFVAEACEFNSSFLHMFPTLAVVLNIEEDHLDYYGDIEHIEAAFGDFLSLLPGNGIALGWGEDERVQRLFKKLNCTAYTFGLDESNDFYPAELQLSDTGCGIFDIMFRRQKEGHVALKVGGMFNVTNALAAFAACRLIGAEAEKICASLENFCGAHRRDEFTGLIDGVKMYHDYGHNPTEMRGAIHVAAMKRPRRLWAVMQPHTYSRVKTLFDGYLTCTEEADMTLVTDIFGAREKDPGDINTSMIIHGMLAHGVQAVHTPTFDDTEKYLRAHWQEGDLVITLGCGNINLLNEQMQKHGDTVKEDNAQ